MFEGEFESGPQNRLHVSQFSTVQSARRPAHRQLPLTLASPLQIIECLKMATTAPGIAANTVSEETGV